MSKSNEDVAASARFLECVRQITRYWAALPGKSAIEVAEGTAFSMLVALDGEAVNCGPYAVRPINEKGEEGEDIAGGLHDAFYAPNRERS